MKIKDIMVTSVTSVTPQTPISEVSDILFANRFHGLPVVENGKLVGIVTEDDFFLKNYDEMYLPSYIHFIKENKTVANLPDDIKDKIEKLLGAKAQDIMTTNCTAARVDMDVTDIMKIIRETKFTTFPVTDSENTLIGIVTLSDILGTVRRGSVEMRDAFKGKFKSKEAEELAKEIDALWKDKLVVMSRKRVITWKGILFISIVAAVGLGIVSYMMISSRKSCEIEQKSVYPMECQRFDYSQWSACAADGTQVRTVLEKIPQNCVGGVPEVVRRCQQ